MKCINCGVVLFDAEKYGHVCYWCCTNDGREDGRMNYIHPLKVMKNYCEKHPHSGRDLLIRCIECEKEKSKK